MGPFDQQFARLATRYNQVAVRELPGVGRLVTVPGVALPSGWSKASTAVHFVAPDGYPFSRPDCFWADADLRLASGAIPHAANITTPVPGTGEGGLWFSWHLQEWNANRDDLMSWFAVVMNRFAKAA